MSIFSNLLTRLPAAARAEITHGSSTPMAGMAPGMHPSGGFDPMGAARQALGGAAPSASPQDATGGIMERLRDLAQSSLAGAGPSSPTPNGGLASIFSQLSQHGGPASPMSSPSVPSASPSSPMLSPSGGIGGALGGIAGTIKAMGLPGANGAGSPSIPGAPAAAASDALAAAAPADPTSPMRRPMVTPRDRTLPQLTARQQNEDAHRGMMRRAMQAPGFEY